MCLLTLLSPLSLLHKIFCAIEIIFVEEGIVQIHNICRMSSLKEGGSEIVRNTIIFELGCGGGGTLKHRSKGSRGTCEVGFESLPNSWLVFISKKEKLRWMI